MNWSTAFFRPHHPRCQVTHDASICPGQIYRTPQKKKNVCFDGETEDQPEDSDDQLASISDAPTAVRCAF